jgi:hypothetical protein
MPMTGLFDDPPYHATRAHGFWSRHHPTRATRKYLKDDPAAQPCFLIPSPDHHLTHSQARSSLELRMKAFTTSLVLCAIASAVSAAKVAVSDIQKGGHAVADTRYIIEVENVADIPTKRARGSVSNTPVFCLGLVADIIFLLLAGSR